MQKAISFNTNRQYTANGQRIAASVLTNDQILMVDVDRGLEYVLDCDLNQSSIMAAYDRHDGRYYWNEMLSSEIRETRYKLKRIANSL